MSLLAIIILFIGNERFSIILQENYAAITDNLKITLCDNDKNDRQMIAGNARHCMR